MISLFNQSANKLELIEDNGDYILDHICTKAEITEELNGEYSFDGTFSIIPTLNIDMYEMLCEGSILKVDDEYGKEYFRIAKVVKTSKKISVFARHITISDILTLFCEDVRPDSQSGNGAINWIFDNAKGTNWFTVGSNISNVNTAYYVNKNVYEALFTADNSFLERWGGEVYRRGFEIRINAQIGTDRGVTIRSRKNLKGFEVTTNINSLTTRVYPKGFNGITIEEKYIDSKYINNYSRIYSKELKFDDVRVNDDNYDEGFNTLAEAQEELKRRVNELFEKDKIDIVPANYRIDFVELGKTEEYKNYSILEKTWLGDTVEVIEDTLNINISVRVLKRQYDVKKGIRISTELSNKDIKEKPPTINDIIKELDKIPESMNDILTQAKEHATGLINAGINGYVVVNKNEILIMDTADKNTATRVWRFNVNGLGYSSTGYYGQYGLAMTMDGQIVADFITTGILNAGIIRAGILKSLDNRTWINMENGTFNFANKVKFDGSVFEIDLTGKDLATNKDVEEKLKFKVGADDVISIIEQTPTSVKIGFNGISVRFGIDNNGFYLQNDAGQKVLYADTKGDVNFTGNLNPTSGIVNLFGNNCRIDGTANAIRLQLNPQTYCGITSDNFIFFNKYSHSGVDYMAMSYNDLGHGMLWNNKTMLKMLGSIASVPEIQCRYLDDRAYGRFVGSDFVNASSEDFKVNIEEPIDINFNDILMKTEIKKYNLKDEVDQIANTPIMLLETGEENTVKPDVKLGVILENLPQEVKEVLNPKGTDGISIYNMVSILWKTCQEQEERIKKLESLIQ